MQSGISPGICALLGLRLDLVEELAALNPPAPELDVDSKPDLAPRLFFLAWFIPMRIYLLFIFGSIVRPRLL